MIWGNRPPDATATQQLPKLSGTIPQRVVTDDLLVGKPTQTVAMVEPYADMFQPAKRQGAAHRKPQRGLTWPWTVAAALLLGTGAFVVVLMSSGPHSPAPAPATSRQAAPESVTVLPPTKPAVKPTREPARPAPRVVLRSARPAPAMRAPVVTVTVTATPTPKPTTPRPTKSVTPSATPSVTPVSPEPTDPEPTPDAPEEAQTTDTEIDDDDA